MPPVEYLVEMPRAMRNTRELVTTKNSSSAQGMRVRSAFISSCRQAAHSSLESPDAYRRRQGRWRLAPLSIVQLLPVQADPQRVVGISHLATTPGEPGPPALQGTPLAVRRRTHGLRRLASRCLGTDLKSGTSSWKPWARQVGYGRLQQADATQQNITSLGSGWQCWLLQPHRQDPDQASRIGDVHPLLPPDHSD